MEWQGKEIWHGGCDTRGGPTKSKEEEVITHVIASRLEPHIVHAEAPRRARRLTALGAGLLALLVLLALGAPPARASSVGRRGEDAAHLPRGRVLKVEGDRVYVDLGAEEGALPGMALVLHETIRLPASSSVDRRAREEHVPVVRTFLVEVGERVSYALLEEEDLHRVELGGRAELIRPGGGGELEAAGPRQERDPEALVPVVARPRYSPDEPLLFDVFLPAGRGRVTVHHRYQGEQVYRRLELDAPTPHHHVGSIGEEVHEGRTLSWYVTVSGESADGQPTMTFLMGHPASPEGLSPPRRDSNAVLPRPDDSLPPSERARRLGFMHDRPGTVTRGRAVGFTAHAPSPLRTPRLHWRRQGELAFQREEMEREPNDHFVRGLPADATKHGDVEYYVTVEDADGHELLAVANPERPARVHVRTDVFDAGAQESRYRGNTHRIAGFGEYVDYGAAEAYSHWETDYYHRLFKFLYRLRMGLGSYEGQGYVRPPEGGDVDPTTQDAIRVAWHYGYTDFEWRLFKHMSVLTKLMLGINNDGVGAGFEGTLRIGDELGLNLEIGGLRAAAVGTCGLFRLNVPAGENWKISGSAWIESLPLDEETGFRMAVDAEWFVTDHWALRARAGMAARTIDRIGPNLGLGLAGHF